jgi:hypothetical protein
MTTPHTAIPKLHFALGGIVTKCVEDAFEVRREAIKHDRVWLVPQCDAAIAQYKVAAIANAGVV